MECTRLGLPRKISATVAIGASFPSQRYVYNPPRRHSMCLYHYSSLRRYFNIVNKLTKLRYAAASNRRIARRSAPLDPQ
ncbi:MAG: hypothetical protein M1588_01870, partial [Planctomycetes bacterium]|nr:hypothetical protein [Planctomycetota bacterium]